MIRAQQLKILVIVFPPGFVFCEVRRQAALKVNGEYAHVAC
jgi:hypothetical protein